MHLPVNEAYGNVGIPMRVCIFGKIEVNGMFISRVNYFMFEVSCSVVNPHWDNIK